MKRIEETLKKYGDVESDASLAKHTTFKIGGKARYFMYPKNELGLLRAIEVCEANQIPFRVFGKGSNILCSDADYEGAIFCLDRYFNDFQFEEDGNCYAQAGVSLVLLAHSAMKESLTGLEFASGIPATLGGALFMNAGAYKSNMASIVQKVYVYKDGVCTWVDANTLEYSYRHSVFQKHPDWIILGAHLKLEKGEQTQIKSLMDSRRQRRIESQPLNMPCAGSIFRNHEEYPAWQLIEEIGYRGKSIGGAQVSEKHANFIVNADHAKASDVIALVEEIQEEVRRKYDIQLKMEVEKFNWQE